MTRDDISVLVRGIQPVLRQQIEAGFAAYAAELQDLKAQVQLLTARADTAATVREVMREVTETRHKNIDLRLEQLEGQLPQVRRIS